MKKILLVSSLIFMCMLILLMSPLTERYFGQLVEKDQAGDVLGELGRLREAITFYGVDHAGKSPTSLDLLIPKYLKTIPSDVLPYWPTPYKTARHPGPMSVRYVKFFAPDDTDGWGYVNNLSDVHFGKVFVNCTHNQWTGKRWCDE